MSKTWFVYKHTSPSGKVYVGITSKPRVNDRWENGTGYAGCTYFRRAISKYGWNNIKHEILLSGISKSEAIYSERYLVRWYKMHNISYNISDGGEGVSGIKLSKEHKEKIGKANIGKNVGKKRTDETRKILSRIFSKPVLQIDLETNEVINEHESIKAASINIGHPGKESNIAHVLHGRYKTAFGFYWKFK